MISNSKTMDNRSYLTLLCGKKKFIKKITGGHCLMSLNFDFFHEPQKKTQ